MDQSKNALGTEPIGKLLIKYAVPAIIGMLVNGLYNVVDRIFIGNIPEVGALAITGVGVAMPIMTIVLAFSLMIGTGAVTNISLKLGQGKREVAEKTLGNAITLAVAVGIVLTVVGLLFSDSILKAFGASVDTLYFAKTYINIILIGSVGSILGTVLNFSIRGDGNPKLSATIMVIGCGLNIVLDALLILVLGMGIKGAAIATVISQCFTAVWGLYYYTSGKSNLGFKKSALKPQVALIKPILAIGCAPFAMQLSASLVQVLNNNALRAYGGDLAIGAMATIASVSLMVGMPIIGLGQGAQPIIGYNYGAKKYERADKTFKICLTICIIGLTLGWVLIQTFPTAVVGMFNKDPELMRITVDGLRKYTMVMPMIAVSYMGSTFVQSMGKAKVAMLVSLLRQVIILIPLILILPSFIQLDGVWYAQAIADTIAGLVTIYVIIKALKESRQLAKERQDASEVANEGKEAVVLQGAYEQVMIEEETANTLTR